MTKRILSILLALAILVMGACVSAEEVDKSKTIKILESYARMERAGVENGGNISSAMKDVEDIMDKLVTGFEKQLDALFDSEAMDVTSEVSVLENMMNLEGLSDLDPFGTLRQDDELIKH